ncbi:hypothetical protein FRB99_004262, partial [Tulasnella sp. 403]
MSTSPPPQPNTHTHQDHPPDQPPQYTPTESDSPTPTQAKNPHDERDEEEDDDRHDTAALLGSADGRTRGRERIAPLSMKAYDDEEEESGWVFAKRLLIETAPTLFLTVIGMVFTGELLERVSRWKALRATDELFFLIPIINNLKGNLEMNLSARLGTAAAMGGLRERRVRKGVVWGNVMLLQVQALVVSAVAALVAFGLGVVLGKREEMPLEMPQDSPPDVPANAT